MPASVDGDGCGAGNDGHGEPPDGARRACGTGVAGSAGSVGTAPGHAEQQMRSGIMAPTMPASRVQIICRCNSLPDLVCSEQAPSGLAAALGRLADTMTKR